MNLRRLVIADVRDLAVDMGEASLLLAPGLSPYRMNRRDVLLFQRGSASLDRLRRFHKALDTLLVKFRD
jgi:hypothetical protein